MAKWTDNAGMYWSTGAGYDKVTDHGRGPIDESYERIENTMRMADGTMRRYSVAKKRTWSTSWTNLPSRSILTPGTQGMRTVDGGLAGQDIERWYKNVNGALYMMLRRGSAINKPIPAVNTWPFQNDDFYFAMVMFTDFSKTVVKRGPHTDLWEVSITLEEV